MRASMESIVVVDYGMSNLRSVAKALEHVATTGQRIKISGDPDVIRRADRVVFPGQGAIGDAMDHMQERGLDTVITEVIRQKPFLGLCLGLQTLMEMSDEDGGTPCFNIFRGHVRRFADRLSDPDTGERLKIPHMGWNQVKQYRDHALWRGIRDNARFYFVHSYFVKPHDDDITVGETRYAVPFTSAAARGNIFAVQFHPEKSQQNGLTLLRNFIGWDGQGN